VLGGNSLVLLVEGTSANVLDSVEVEELDIFVVLIGVRRLGSGRFRVGGLGAILISDGLVGVSGRLSGLDGGDLLDVADGEKSNNGSRNELHCLIY